MEQGLNAKLNAFMKDEVEGWEDITWKIYDSTPAGAFWYIPEDDDVPGDDNIIEGETGEKFYMDAVDAAWQWCGSEIASAFDAPTFDALVTALEKLAKQKKETLAILENRINYTFLPTWGPEPADVESVWSWDETRKLVGHELPFSVEPRYDVEE